MSMHKTTSVPRQINVMRCHVMSLKVYLVPFAAIFDDFAASKS